MSYNPDKGLCPACKRGILQPVAWCEAEAAICDKGCPAYSDPFDCAMVDESSHVGCSKCEAIFKTE